MIMLGLLNKWHWRCGLVVCIAGCQSRPAPQNVAPPDLTELKRTENLVPATEFKKSVAKKDLRFIAVRGVGTEVPGVKNGIANPLVEKYGVNPVDGTSDFIQSNEQARLDRVARRYAEAYNTLLIEHLTKRRAAKAR